jgi:hypothetical protein
VDVELVDIDVLVVEVDKVVKADEEEVDVVERVLLEAELEEVDNIDVLLDELELLPAVDETVELDVTGMLDELELDGEDVLLLELETDTGLRLLYIDNRFAPPHYKGY